ncbi:MAG: elongation factor P [Acidobacteriia bacterium]|nr:elongation factor P [Terriglobia bacterium]
MVVASQLRAGMAVRFEGQSYKVLAAEYHPGQGKMGGVAHVRLQNTATGTFWEHSFRADLKLEDLAVEKQSLEFLYEDGAQCCFMNPENYEQTEVPAAMIGPQAPFLEAGKRISVEFVEGRPIGALFPDNIEVVIADTAPPLHQQVDSTFKPAKLANGVEIMVPQFIKTGDAIRLDLQTMKYMDRVKARHA